MKAIYKADEGRITIAEAKRLILDALPVTKQVNIYVPVDTNGEILRDGPIGTEVVDEPMAAPFLTKAIIGAMNEGLIKPRVTFNPAFTDYKGSESDDEHFGISHKEFEALAEQFDCRVEVGEPPAIEQTSETQHPEDSIDFDKLATREQLIEAFGKFTGMDASWFDNLKDTPALMEARKVVGVGGKRGIVPLFCPFEVMQWLVNPKRRRGRPMNEETGWRVLEHRFSRVFNARSAGDPRQD